MQNFLAVDTSGNYLTVVAVHNGKAYSTFIENCAMRHSVALMGAVDETLQKANLALEDCDFFGAVVGAGSFTGIRIGISAAKGFALATGKPTLGVTSFDVIAYNTMEQTQGKILCLINALHDAYYACGYENGQVCFAPAYLTEEEVLALAGQGYALYACGELPIAQKVPVQVVSPVDGLQKAVSARASQSEFGELNAWYVRKSSAEIQKCK